MKSAGITINQQRQLPTAPRKQNHSVATSQPAQRGCERKMTVSDLANVHASQGEECSPLHCYTSAVRLFRFWSLYWFGLTYFVLASESLLSDNLKTVQGPSVMPSSFLLCHIPSSLVLAALTTASVRSFLIRTYVRQPNSIGFRSDDS